MPGRPDDFTGAAADLATTFAVLTGSLPFAGTAAVRAAALAGTVAPWRVPEPCDALAAFAFVGAFEAFEVFAVVGAFEAFEAFAVVGAFEAFAVVCAFEVVGAFAVVGGFAVAGTFVVFAVVAVFVVFAVFDAFDAFDAAEVVDAVAAFEAARPRAGTAVDRDFAAVRPDVDVPACGVAARLGALDRADFALVFALVLGIGIVRSEKPDILVEYGAGYCRKCPATLIKA